MISGIKRYNLWQRLTGKPEADRQHEKLEAFKKRMTEHLESGSVIAHDLTTREIQELLRLLP